MKRKLSAFLALLLAANALAFASCSTDAVGQSGNEGSVTTAADTEAPETEDPKILPDLPDVTFDGASFRFYTWDANDYRVWDDLNAEEENGEPINDAVYRRNRTIEAKYQITITEQIDYFTDYVTNVLKAVSAQDDNWEVIISMGHHCVPSLYSTACLNLYDLDYVDFTKPWWNQNAIDSFTLGGYMPFVTSDLTILDKGTTGVVFFNKKLADDYGVGNLYDQVYNNTWTIETMIEKGKMVSEDVNGDSVYDENDRYGILGYDAAVIFLFHGSGARLVSKDSDDMPVASFSSERNYTVIKYYLENMLYDEKLCLMNTAEPLFMNNQALFTFACLRAANGMRNMDTDYGILPIPKYDTAQESYGHTVFTHGNNLISVPITSGHLDMVGVILEALSAESKYTVIPAFYETTLKEKGTRDQDSIAMLDIILDSMVFDLGDYYCIGYLNDYFLRITGSAHSINADYPTRTSDVASFYEKYSKTVQSDIKKLIKQINKMNGQ